MVRDPRSLLWDAREAADAVMLFTRDRRLDDYIADRMLSAAVERKFEVLGEALNKLSKVAPDLAVKIPELRRIVAFRNLLIHGYASVDDAVVWRTAKDDVPALRETIAALLAGLG
jgi:uncharacterized protein with HEPN domain